MNKLGVVGSGIMGSGIGQTAAQNGYDVILYDIAAEQLSKARQSMEAALRKRVDSGKMAQEEMDSTLAAMRFSSEITDLKDREIIVEAVVENVELKQKIFEQLEQLADKDCILATNTSSLSLAEISSKMNEPDRLVGVHFFNPVPAMKLVELVKTTIVRPEILEKAREFAVSLGKTAITAPDTPGFIVNYLIYPFRLNAMRMVEMGMATPEDIDTAARLGLGHPMGPLELQDLVGMDVTYAATSSVYEKTQNPAMKPPDIMRRMIEEGKLGRKTGQGFYSYPEKK